MSTEKKRRLCLACLKSVTEPQKIAHAMQMFLSAALFVLGAILSVLLLLNSWNLIQIVFVTHEVESNEILGTIVTWFLYFEFLALIAKYYQAGLHFPLRYFIYIGVTAVVRLIILYHDNSIDTLVQSFAILVLLGALWLANTDRIRRNDQ